MGKWRRPLHHKRSTKTVINMRNIIEIFKVYIHLFTKRYFVVCGQLIFLQLLSDFIQLVLSFSWSPYLYHQWHSSWMFMCLWGSVKGSFCQPVIHSPYFENFPVPFHNNKLNFLREVGKLFPVNTLKPQQSKVKDWINGSQPILKQLHIIYVYHVSYDVACLSYPFSVFLCQWHLSFVPMCLHDLTKSFILWWLSFVRNMTHSILPCATSIL